MNAPRITITAFKWVPPFAQGQVRDHRLRWVLKEVGWPYAVRLLDAQMQADPAYVAEQPFGQVPVMEEEGRAPMWETGAIVLDVATRSGRLLPLGADDRSRAVCWLFSALNSVEPFLADLAEVDFFMTDDAEKARRRPRVMKMVDKRLGQLDAALAGRAYLVGEEFSVADLMLSSVMKIVGHTDVLDAYPDVKAHRDRCFARPAYGEAIADQCRTFSEHTPADMKYPAAS